jgi:hypothetical protein
MVERKRIDWEGIEADYRIGDFSVRAIGRVHGVSEGAIRKRADAENWVRSNKGAVRKNGAQPKVRTKPSESEKIARDEPKSKGRPTSYDPEFSKEAMKLCTLGATDTEIADFFEVDARTIYRWQASYPEFCQALRVGKDSCDDRVERSLYHRAVGYSHDVVKVFQVAGKPLLVPYREHVAPDVSAASLWLKNRRKDVWRDKHEVEHTGAVTIKKIERVIIDPIANDDSPAALGFVERLPKVSTRD